FFRLGIGIIIVSFFVVGISAAAGIPAPSYLIESSGLLSLLSKITGSSVSSTSSIIGLGAFAGIGTLFSLISSFTGQIGQTIGRAQALVTYVSLFTLAGDGISTLMKLFIMFFRYWVPPLSGTIVVLSTTVTTLASIFLGYYLLVRVFGVPSE
ncbi:MAG: hypothetical protein QW575_07995, partial [Thermoproteota archaeon]